jgi:hypothetical protein
LSGTSFEMVSGEVMLDPDMMLGTSALAAARASMRSAPRRNSSAIPVGEIPNGPA